MTPTDIKGLWYDAAQHAYWMRAKDGMRLRLRTDPSLLTEYEYREGKRPLRHWYSAVPSVTAILARAGLSDISRVTPEALARGTAVHAACEDWMRQCPDWERPDWRETYEPLGYKAPHETIEYLLGFNAFMVDLRWKPLHSERVVFSRQHWYCGRMDCVFELPSQKKRKKNVLVDLKTNTMPEHVGVQLAAYRWAAIESKIPIHSAICLVLKPNTYRVWDHDKEGSPREDWHKFKEALTNGTHRKNEE